LDETLSRETSLLEKQAETTKTILTEEQQRLNKTKMDIKATEKETLLNEKELKDETKRANKELSDEKQKLDKQVELKTKRENAKVKQLGNEALKMDETVQQLTKELEEEKLHKKKTRTIKTK